METIETYRAIDPFFEDATNQVFLNPDKTSFVMDGPIGIGKSSNFLMRSAYMISQYVEPTKIGKRLVRQSLWAGIRESENSAKNTFLQLLRGGIFSPAIMSSDDSPVSVYGAHPSYILIKHALPDGTELEMRIECHGFNNAEAENRLRTREYLGALIPEMQGIPYTIYEVGVERCGRWMTDSTRISKVINGKKYTLSGVTGLAIVLCDMNIPPRPHAVYKEYYDNPQKEKLPVLYITPPPPLLHIPVDKATDAILEKYPVTRFEGKDYVWVPNPKAYNMTRHYEEEDENGNRIPWSGYKYWFSRLHRTDSAVRRYIIGKPDTSGGPAAMYGNFTNNSATVFKRDLDRSRTVYVSIDPGTYAGIILGQVHPRNKLHFFKEFIFQPVDRATTRIQIRDFLLPYCRRNFAGMKVIIILDPASSWLGKNQMTGQAESVAYQIQSELRREREKHPQAGVVYKIEPCRVSNQHVQVRIDSLGTFVDKGTLSVDPSLTYFIGAMQGQYKRKELKSGVISDTIDKDNRPWADIAEAAQYAAVNILHKIKQAMRNGKGNTNRGIYRVRRKPR